MGFSLYINSRTEVEGWDLQLLFGKFAEKRGLPKTPVDAETPFPAAPFPKLKFWESPGKKSGNPGAFVPRIPPPSGAIPLILLGILLFFTPPPGRAEPPQEGRAAGPPLEKLEKVFESEDFGSEKDGWGIRLKRRDYPGLDPIPWVEKIKGFFAHILLFFLAALIAASAVFLLACLLKNRRAKTKRPGKRRLGNTEAPSGEDPGLMLEKALSLYGQGELRPAWAACLGACLGFLSRDRRFLFPREATEYDCLALMERGLGGDKARARSYLPPERTVDILAEFSFLVDTWINLAYGGQLPPGGAFERAAAFGKALEAAHE
jgi:hypothetical protein